MSFRHILRKCIDKTRRMIIHALKRWIDAVWMIVEIIIADRRESGISARAFKRCRSWFDAFGLRLRVDRADGLGETGVNRGRTFCTAMTKYGFARLALWRPRRSVTSQPPNNQENNPLMYAIIVLCTLIYIQGVSEIARFLFRLYNDTLDMRFICLSKHLMKRKLQLFNIKNLFLILIIYF